MFIACKAQQVRPHKAMNNILDEPLPRQLLKQVCTFLHKQVSTQTEHLFTQARFNPKHAAFKAKQAAFTANMHVSTQAGFNSNGAPFHLSTKPKQAAFKLNFTF